jgi:putative hydrolase of the HAD superfamily
MLTRLKSDPTSAWMIGDSLKIDIEGGRAAGMKTIWINRSGEENNGSVVPDFTISSLTELSLILPGD